MTNDASGKTAGLRERVAAFVRDRLVPLENRVAAEDAIPAEVVDEMRRLGLFGMSIPSAYGGLGLSMAEEVAIAFELGQTSPAFRSVIGINNGVGSQAIVMDGTDEQRRHLLPRLASGETIVAFCLTEPEAGSDAASLATTARLEGEHYVLEGTKRYVTNGPQADLFIVFARSDPDAPGARGISAFLVDAASAGIELGPPDRKMGQRGVQSCDVVFRDCRVPASSLLGDQEGQGFKTAMKALDRGRLHIAALCAGIAERLIRDSLAFAMKREQFGQPIAEFQLVQAMLADSRAEAYAARAMVEDAAHARDAGEDVTLKSACCKMFAAEMVGRVADRAVQIHGGAGYVSDYKVERFYRDVRLFRVLEGTTQIQQLVIARNMIRQAKASAA